MRTRAMCSFENSEASTCDVIHFKLRNCNTIILKWNKFHDYTWYFLIVISNKLFYYNVAFIYITYYLRQHFKTSIPTSIVAPQSRKSTAPLTWVMLTAKVYFLKHVHSMFSFVWIPIHLDINKKSNNIY